PEIVSLFRLAAHRHHVIAAAREDIDGDARHAAGGAVDEHLALRRRKAVQFHEVDGVRRRVPGNAERTRFEEAHAARQRNHPVGRKASEFRVAAVVIRTEAETVHEHLVARFEARVRRFFDGARKVDPRDERKFLGDPRLAARGERVLVVDARVGDAQHHVAGVEFGALHFAQTAAAELPSLENPVGLHTTVTPPSATMTWPVTNAAASEARNTAMPPMSRGTPRRRSGVESSRALRRTASSHSALAKSVLIRPGAMALTRTFFGPHSAARLRTRWWSAAFEVPYAPITVFARMPPIDPTVMKQPPPREAMPGRVSAASHSTLFTLLRNTLSKTSS